MAQWPHSTFRHLEKRSSLHHETVALRLPGRLLCWGLGARCPCPRDCYQSQAQPLPFDPGRKVAPSVGKHLPRNPESQFLSNTTAPCPKERKWRDGAFEDCCLGYQSNLKWSILKRAKCYRKQEVSGSCNLPAVIFYFRQKGLVCANPEDKDVKRILLPRNKPAGSPRKCTPGSHTERKKSNHAKSKLGNLRITSRRNATLGRPRLFLLEELQLDCEPQGLVCWSWLALSSCYTHHLQLVFPRSWSPTANLQGAEAVQVTHSEETLVVASGNNITDLAYQTLKSWSKF
ncbi:hypothetical protein U0070_022619 [Myodes glareolus]|uniref:Chemokine interleukin-8-like domain-containing protein n=1 Tax=Myodes glareolus TaxID=447135 RepID=A0AAW0HA69_MYOGA